MIVITLRDYAKQNNISYEAVRKQVVRYADELGEHLIRDGRQQFLDEEAVAFLDGKRQKNPIAIIQIDKDETIERLRAEKENLLKELTLAERAARENAEIAGKVKLLEGIKDAQEGRISDLSREVGELAQREAQARREAQALSEELSVIRGKWWYKIFGGKK